MNACCGRARVLLLLMATRMRGPGNSAIKDGRGNSGASLRAHPSRFRPRPVSAGRLSRMKRVRIRC